MKRPPRLVTEPELWQDGPPVRVRDLVAITGLSEQTIRGDIAAGVLEARHRASKPNTPYLIQRAHARRYVSSMGFQSHAC